MNTHYPSGNQDGQLRFDRSLIKSPDQFVLRLNQLVEKINREEDRQIIRDRNSNKVIFIGLQPDNLTFGIRMYTRDGDQYNLITTVI
jgi:hypothetical protein